MNCIVQAVYVNVIDFRRGQLTGLLLYCRHGFSFNHLSIRHYLFHMICLFGRFVKNEYGSIFYIFELTRQFQYLMNTYRIISCIESEQKIESLRICIFGHDFFNYIFNLFYIVAAVVSVIFIVF